MRYAAIFVILVLVGLAVSALTHDDARPSSTSTSNPEAQAASSAIDDAGSRAARPSSSSLDSVEDAAAARSDVAVEPEPHESDSVSPYAPPARTHDLDADRRNFARWQVGINPYLNGTKSFTSRTTVDQLIGDTYLNPTGKVLDASWRKQLDELIVESSKEVESALSTRLSAQKGALLKAIDRGNVLAYADQEEHHALRRQLSERHGPQNEDWVEVTMSLSSGDWGGKPHLTVYVTRAENPEFFTTNDLLVGVHSQVRERYREFLSRAP